MTDARPQSRQSATADPTSAGRLRARAPLRLVYLRCIPTVVQAAEKREERGWRRGREEGGGLLLLLLLRKNDAAAVLGSCRLGRDQEREEEKETEMGRGRGRLAQSEVSDVGFTAAIPSGSPPSSILQSGPSLPARLVPADALISKKQKE